jgi:lysozyme
VAQAENFLERVGAGDDTLRVLDFEPNPTGPSMSLEEARAFVVHVREATGRFPGFYSGHAIKQALGTATDPTLQQCWFWLAQYGPTAVVPPNWDRWTLWQYTDGALGPQPHDVGGMRLDRDLFNGTAAQLRDFWLH